MFIEELLQGNLVRYFSLSQQASSYYSHSRARNWFHKEEKTPVKFNENLFCIENAVSVPAMQRYFYFISLGKVCLLILQNFEHCRSTVKTVPL